MNINYIFRFLLHYDQLSQISLSSSFVNPYDFRLPLPCYYILLKYYSIDVAKGRLKRLCDLFQSNAGRCNVLEIDFF